MNETFGGSNVEQDLKFYLLSYPKGKKGREKISKLPGIRNRGRVP
jgi:hypothetical protein